MKYNLKQIILLLRPHQYVKNLFIFLPLFFVGEITNIDSIISALLAFIAFSVTASSIYILNDFRDIKEDLQHPKKKHRPLAANTVSRNTAIVLMVLLFVIGISLMAILSYKAVVVLGIYIVLNINYSFYLKNIAILDITCIAIGFVLRLVVGATLFDISLSMWIIITTFLLSLFLALAKRRDDVLYLKNDGKKMRKSISGYNLKLIDGMLMVMASVVIVSYIMYTTSESLTQKFESEYLYLTALFVILGIMRYMQITLVEQNSGSPTVVFITDRFMQLTIISWILSYVYIIYI